MGKNLAHLRCDVPTRATTRVAPTQKGNSYTKNLIIGGICTLVFLRPLVSGLTYPWSNTYAQSLILLLSLIWILTICWKKASFSKTHFDIPLLTFFLCLTVSASQSVHSAVSLNHVYQFMSYVLLYFLITNNVRTKEDRRKIISALYLSTTLVCIYGIYQYFQGLDRARDVVDIYHSGKYSPEFMMRLHTQKAFSTFVFPPALAGFLILVMPLSISVCLTSKARLKWICFYSPLLILFCLILTFSKGGWLSGLLSVLVFGFIWLVVIKEARRIVVLIGLAIPILIFTFLLVFDYLPQATLSGFINSFVVRSGYWKAVPPMVQDYLLIGSGPGTFGTIYPGYRLLLGRETQMAHNNYLQILVETGIIGFIAFLWLSARFLKRGIRLIMEEKTRKEKILLLGYFAGVSGFLIHSLVDFGLYIPGIATTVFIFLALMVSPTQATARVAPTQKENSFAIKLFLTIVILFVTTYMLFVVRRPMLGEKYLSLAYKSAGKGEINKAVSSLEKAIECCPRQAKYYFQLGLIYEGKISAEKKQDGKYQTRRIWLNKAIRAYEMAAKYNPHMAVYHSRLAWLYWSKSSGRNKDLIKKAITEMQRAVLYYPAVPRYHMQLGRMYHLAGEYESARKEYILTFKHKDAIYRQSEVGPLNDKLKQVEIWLKEITR